MNMMKFCQNPLCREIVNDLEENSHNTRRILIEIKNNISPHRNLQGAQRFNFHVQFVSTAPRTRVFFSLD